MNNYEKLLIDNKQDHLLEYVEMAGKRNKSKLIKQIENVDYKQIQDLYNISQRDKTKAVKSYIIEHIKFRDKSKITKEELQELKNLGEKVIKNNEYAVVTMAGGQRNKIRA